MDVILENSRTIKECLRDKPMPDEPKEKPTYEDIERELGLDKMSFMSEMLRLDQHEEREEDADLPTAPTSSESHLHRRKSEP